MGLYGPDVEDAMAAYSTQFDDLRQTERKPIIDANAINPLSELRETWQNTTSNQTEHHLQTSASTDEVAYLETKEHGQYTAGYQAECGIGVRIPETPTKDEVMRWGYFTDLDPAGDQTADNGWYFGVDSTGVFVAEVRNESVRKVYQENWNVDVADGTDDAETNPSGFDLSLSKGNIFQIEFVYYGYGPVRMQILTDDHGIVTLHTFRHDGQTSVENTNLPIEAQIDNGSTNSDALDLYVGGRQFSIIGSETTNARRAGHYRDSIAVDDTQWHPVISVRLKDTTDFGPTKFTHIIGSVIDFELDTDNSAYRWQIRRGTAPDNPTWQIPSSHVDKPNETGMKVDVTSTSITDGSGNLTGVFVDGGGLSSGGNNEAAIQGTDSSGDIVGSEIVTFALRAVPDASGTVSEIFLSWEEDW